MDRSEINRALADQATKTQALQKQIICPIWAVWFGSSVKVYVAKWHAEQMLRALRLEGTDCSGFSGAGEAI